MTNEEYERMTELGNMRVHEIDEDEWKEWNTLGDKWLDDINKEREKNDAYTN